VISYLSDYWKVPTNSVTVWDDDLLLGSESKLSLFVDYRTKQDRILQVRVNSAAPVKDEKLIDVSAIDRDEQERIFRRIKQAQGGRSSKWMIPAPSPRVGRLVRTVMCRIRGKRFRMIVDTGAAVSVLYLHQVELCGARSLIDESDRCKVSLVSVGEQKSRSVGVIPAIEIEIGGLKTEASFAVLDTHGSMGLLGIDWLARADATIRVADDLMEVRGRRIKFEDP
jgi:hypothetical protein